MTVILIDYSRICLRRSRLCSMEIVAAPIPAREISRQVMAEYTLIVEAPTGFQTEGCTFIETSCVGGCPHMHRLDSMHPEYAAVKAALDRGDRSRIFCYHKTRS